MGDEYPPPTPTPRRLHFDGSGWIQTSRPLATFLSHQNGPQPLPGSLAVACPSAPNHRRPGTRGAAGPGEHHRAPAVHPTPWLRSRLPGSLVTSCWLPRLDPSFPPLDPQWPCITDLRLSLAGALGSTAALHHRSSWPFLRWIHPPRHLPPCQRRRGQGLPLPLRQGGPIEQLPSPIAGVAAVHSLLAAVRTMVSDPRRIVHLAVRVRFRRVFSFYSRFCLCSSARSREQCAAPPPMWFIHGHLLRSPRAGQVCAGPPWVGKWTARHMASGGARAAPCAAPSCTGFAPSAARLALPCSSGVQLAWMCEGEKRISLFF
ncbi:uncharacterized protein [Aegilops tauschii subsp. strangulata]|uniref:uncharacterized protein n=1 Tax=Aegilops tauschii subsp. strangulata TaxID=200361 RepID=UPI001ABBE2F9|nr:uncharacterized protein LOC120968806 [Aegilops tauschii subsp. strangulata]